MKGNYILLIELENDRNIQVGKLGNIFFKKGFYVYVGSALNGLKQRINRHLRQEKKFHWHIDYLLQFGEIVNISYKESTKSEECIIAEKLEKKLFPIPHFGSSDCKCISHLFYSPKKEIIDTINSLDMDCYLDAKT